MLKAEEFIKNVVLIVGLINRDNFRSREEQTLEPLPFQAFESTNEASRQLLVLCYHIFGDSKIHIIPRTYSSSKLNQTNLLSYNYPTTKKGLSHLDLTL
jgi:hypothetical protein